MLLLEISMSFIRGSIFIALIAVFFACFWQTSVFADELILTEKPEQIYALDTVKENPEETSGAPATPSADCEMIILPREWCSTTSGNGIKNMTRFVMNLLLGGVTLVGTIGIVVCGFMWMMARDNETMVMRAKVRLFEIVVGMIIFVTAELILNLLGFSK